MSLLGRHSCVALSSHRWLAHPYCRAQLFEPTRWRARSERAFLRFSSDVSVPVRKSGDDNTHPLYPDSLMIISSTKDANPNVVDYTIVHPVPGHGKPLRQEDWKADEHEPFWTGKTFPSVLSMDGIDHAAVPNLTTMREFYMLRFMNAITDKDDWHVKVLDDAIATEWKSEAITAAQNAHRKARGVEDDDLRAVSDNAFLKNGSETAEDREGEVDEDEDTSSPYHPFHTVPRDESNMTQAMADYCIAELQHRAREFAQSPNGAIFVYNGDVFKSDTAVSSETKLALVDAVRALEDVPQQAKNWHPGSDNQVLDLVHPSLFPVIYGRTKALPHGTRLHTLDECVQHIGKGDVLPVPAGIENPPNEGVYGLPRVDFNPYSDKFQWLPCEVDITGDKAKIVSYINNLHPEHRVLYSLIEDVITAAIPLWNLTLAPLADTNGYRYTPHMRVPFVGAQFDPDTREWNQKDGGPQGDEDDDDFCERQEEWIRKYQRTILPEPGTFSPESLSSPPAFSLKERLAPTKRPLQVIVKLANIELTTESPNYPGGTWHVEGKLNEHIVATALYYYSSSNITPSSLAFRQVAQYTAPDAFPYLQDDHGWLSDIFGLYNEAPSVQVAGSVHTREGRLLTFPNVLQHQVQPFSLEDPTKPGYRKVVALFLVDPNIRILSSAMVPPQQLDWLKDDLEFKDKSLYGEVDDFPISLAEAKKLREELMEERKKYSIEQGEAFESMWFSLCEH